MEMILILHNIRSTYNVGAILRTSEGFGVKKVILSGYTPATEWTKGATALPHTLEKTTAQIAKTAVGAEEMVECEWSEDIAETLEELKRAGYIVAGLENNLEDEDVYELEDWEEAVEETMEERATETAKINIGGVIRVGVIEEAKNAGLVLVLGEEVEGIDHSLFDKIDFFLEIPMVGKKESFNVSVAAGIAMYELLGD